MNDRPVSAPADIRDARRQMLDDVRRHLRASPLAPAPPQEGGGTGVAPVVAATAAGEDSGPALVERFRVALEAVAGRCLVVADLAGAARALRDVLEQHRPRRIAVSDSPLVARAVAAAGTGAEVLAGADASTLFGVDVGITTAQWAVAETGTLVLDGDAERHRLASLVPPVHVALVPAWRVRPTIGSVLAELGGRDRDALSRCVTFVTGPSRTSDIELTLAIGVHGPGALHVIVVEQTPAEA
jgi:L-lactate dehydrogenase complex protein LldG